MFVCIAQLSPINWHLWLSFCFCLYVCLTGVNRWIGWVLGSDSSTPFLCLSIAHPPIPYILFLSLSDISSFFLVDISSIMRQYDLPFPPFILTISIKIVSGFFNRKLWGECISDCYFRLIIRDSFEFICFEITNSQIADLRDKMCSNSYVEKCNYWVAFHLIEDIKG